jgi:hypothetical protein
LVKYVINSALQVFPRKPIRPYNMNHIMHGSILVVTTPSPSGNPRDNAVTLIPGWGIVRKFCPAGFPGVKSKTRIQDHVLTVYLAASASSDMYIVQ